MLDFGFSEILLTSAIALVVLGPERLPKVARQVGNWMGRARAMARQLSEQLEREVNADELLKERTPPGSSTDNRIAPPGPTYVPPAHAPYDPPPAADIAPATADTHYEPPQGHGMPPHENYEPSAEPVPVTHPASNPPNG